MNNDRASVGVLLMTYGSPQSLDDVPAYMANVRGGHPADPPLVEEFIRRYRLIGGSPLVAITRAQSAALQEELTRRHPHGPVFHVEAGMRFSSPSVAESIAALGAQGVSRLAGIIMSPQYSPILMGGYHRALDEAVQSLDHPLPAHVMGSWHRQPLFIRALAGRLQEALARVPAELHDSFHVLLTAHSMPRRVVDREPDYIAQLQETAQAVATEVGLPDDRWSFCYQSAGHTPEEWLKPDFADVMPQLATAGIRCAVIAPVQFLADHLEILYDVEVGAREQAETHGLTFIRTASLNTAPLFIQALAFVAEECLHSIPAEAVASVST